VLLEFFLFPLIIQGVTGAFLKHEGVRLFFYDGGLPKINTL
jgi:hypothetical protein